MSSCIVANTFYKVLNENHKSSENLTFNPFLSLFYTENCYFVYLYAKIIPFPLNCVFL